MKSLMTSTFLTSGKKEEMFKLIQNFPFNFKTNTTGRKAAGLGIKLNINHPGGESRN